MTGQVTAPIFASVTPTEVIVTLPVFVTRNVYAMVDPALLSTGRTARLVHREAGLAAIGVSCVVARHRVARPAAARTRSPCCAT